MNLLEAQRIFEADSPSFSRRDEAQITHKKYPTLVDRFFSNAVQFACKNMGQRVAQISSPAPRYRPQRNDRENWTASGRYDARIWRSLCKFAIASRNDGCAQGCSVPRACAAAITSVAASSTTPNPVQFQLPDDRGFSSARCACDDEPSHGLMPSFELPGKAAAISPTNPRRSVPKSSQSDPRFLSSPADVPFFASQFLGTKPRRRDK